MSFGFTRNVGSSSDGFQQLCVCSVGLLATTDPTHRSMLALPDLGKLPSRKPGKLQVLFSGTLSSITLVEQPTWLENCLGGEASGNRGRAIVLESSNAPSLLCIVVAAIL